jgi:hypothetical protein
MFLGSELVLSIDRAGGLYSHTAAKILFLRIFRGRNESHLYSHTVLGWSVWGALCFLSIAIAYVLATAVPIFSVWHLLFPVSCHSLITSDLLVLDRPSS